MNLKFRINDKVKIVNSLDSGTIVLIKHYKMHEPYFVKLDMHDGDYADFREDELELIERKENAN